MNQMTYKQILHAEKLIKEAGGSVLELLKIIKEIKKGEK